MPGRTWLYVSSVRLMEACPDRWQSEWLKARGLLDWAAYYEELEAQREREIV